MNGRHAEEFRVALLIGSQFIRQSPLKTTKLSTSGSYTVSLCQRTSGDVIGPGCQEHKLSFSQSRMGKDFIITKLRFKHLI